MKWTASLPPWLSAGVLAAIVVAILALVGWIKPYLAGPDFATTTIYRVRPVPVEVERVRWLERVKVRTERVEVPVEVIREVPAKVEQRLADDFGIRLPELPAENREFIDVVAVPKAPHGGEMAITVSTETGKIDGIFRPLPAPLVEFGGIRELGVDYDPINATAGAYYRQDLVRLGPAVVNATAFARASREAGSDIGGKIGVAIRF
jgi:hypothetical protein